MGRRRTIDRDQLLDAAEAVIAREGAAGLTIDAVAKEMGITKGGVQYCFGTKDALIDAIFERINFSPVPNGDLDKLSGRVARDSVGHELARMVFPHAKKQHVP